MKILKYFLCSAILILLLAGCTQQQGTEVQPEVEDITKGILEQIEFSEMVEATTDNISFMYDLNADEFDDYSVYYAGSGGYADEIAVIKVSSQDDIDKVKTAFDERITSRTSDFKGYAPLESEKLENAVVEQKGNYIFLAICDDTDKAVNIFEDSFNKQ